MAKKPVPLSRGEMYAHLEQWTFSGASNAAIEQATPVSTTRQRTATSRRSTCPVGDARLRPAAGLVTLPSFQAGLLIVATRCVRRNGTASNAE